MNLSKNLFHAAIFKKLQKYKDSKVEQSLKKTLRDALDLEESSCKKAKKTANKTMLGFLSWEFLSLLLLEKKRFAGSVKQLCTLEGAQ